MTEFNKVTATCTVVEGIPPTPDYITRELALSMIDEHSVSLGGISHIGRTDTGEEPDWNPYEAPSSATYQWIADCKYEVGVRYCIMDGTKEKVCPKNLYYWLQLEDRWEQEWKPDGLGLPFYVGLIGWTTSLGVVVGHWVCALKVGPNVSSFSNWVFFNYNDREILPGNASQMPYGAHVAVHECIGATNAGAAWPDGLAIAEWNV